jgi:hypothetical protein
LDLFPRSRLLVFDWGYRFLLMGVLPGCRLRGGGFGCLLVPWSLFFHLWLAAASFYLVVLASAEIR